MEIRLQEEEFYYDEAAEAGTENGDGAEEMTSEDMMIDDDALENVSGGSAKSDTFYCYYCKVQHVLYRCYPWRIRPAGEKKWCNAATKYTCTKNGDFFTVNLAGGGIAYYDKSVRRVE